MKHLQKLFCEDPQHATITLPAKNMKKMNSQKKITNYEHNDQCGQETQIEHDLQTSKSIMSHHRSIHKNSTYQNQIIFFQEHQVQQLNNYQNTDTHNSIKSSCGSLKLYVDKLDILNKKPFNPQPLIINILKWPSVCWPY